eukprot:8319232-Heterocapsa_arctica.AAC.1
MPLLRLTPSSRRWDCASVFHRLFHASLSSPLRRSPGSRFALHAPSARAELSNARALLLQAQGDDRLSFTAV